MFFAKQNMFVDEENLVLMDLNKFEIYKLDEEDLKVLTSINHHEVNALDECKDSEIYDKFFKPRDCENKFEQPFIQSVKIHVSNSCNLKCKYCYANHGNYNTCEGVMSMETASSIVEYIKGNVPKTRNITFFGGEPLMAVDVIAYICDAFEGSEVRFLMQTNGTIINERIINLINKYNITLTVSIDGPKEINDANRTFPNGMGTFDNIVNNVEEIQKRTSQRIVAVQATYTSNAKEKSVFVLANYLYKATEARIISIKEVDTDQEGLRAVFDFDRDYDVESYVRTVYEERFILDNEILHLLTAFLTKTYASDYCNAGLSNMTIDVEGNIWPCQLFINKSGYCMGSIADYGNIDKHFRLVRDKMSKNSKSNLKKCSLCISRFFCARCPGLSKSNEESCDEITKMGLDCEHMRELTEKVLKKLAEMIANETILDFVKKYSCIIKV